MNRLMDHFGLEGGRCRIIGVEPSAATVAGYPTYNMPHAAGLFLVEYSNEDTLVDKIRTWLRCEGYQVHFLCNYGLCISLLYLIATLKHAG